MQSLTGIERDTDGFDIRSAVGDFDDGVGRVVGLPLRERIVDAREVFLRADKIEVVHRWLRQRALVFASAHVGAERVVVSDPNALATSLRWRKSDASKHWVDCNLLGQRTVGPICKVSDHNRTRVNQRQLRARAGPYFEALAVTVVIRNTAGHGLGRLTALKTLKAAARNRRREVEPSGGMRRSTPASVVQGRVIAQHAEHKTVRTLLLFAEGRGLCDGVRFQAPDEHSYTRNVVELRKMPGPNTSDVHDVGNFFKSAAQIVEPIAVTHINRTAAVEVQVIDILRET